MRASFVNAIIQKCRERDDIIILSGDAGLGLFDELQKEMPARFLNCGVAEQNLASFAAGLAMTDCKVYIYNIIPFLLYRCYEQVRNDICDQKLPVVLVGTGSGVTYAPAGISHYAVEDIGLARTLPNLTVISPADPVEAETAAIYSLTAEAPVYVRMAKSGELPVGHSSNDIDITVPQVIREGTDIAIVFHGSISDEVMAAHNRLADDNIAPLLLSVPMLQPLAEKELLARLQDMKAVLCVEEHFQDTGLGSIMRCLHSTHCPSWSLQTKGIDKKVLVEVFDTSQLRKRSGISSQDIRAAVLKLREGLTSG